MSNILKTTDYSIFKKHNCNRDLHPLNLKRLTESLKIKNLLEFNPIIVDNEMNVLDGQHRLEVAKNLNLPVYYIINEKSSDNDMALLNNNQKKWSIMDYVKYYERRGNVEYLKIRKFLEKYQLSVEEYLSFTSSGYKGGKHYRKFKLGNYSFLDETNYLKACETIEKRKKVIETFKRLVFGHSHTFSTVRFKIALLNFLNNPDVDVDVFIRKIEMKAEAFRKCVGIVEYIELFRNIYNYKNTRPLSDLG